MSLTDITNRSDELVDTAAGDLTSDLLDITFDSSYPTGGEVYADADFGFTKILGIVFLTARAAGVYSAQRLVWNAVDKKLKLESAAGVEATNASDQSTFTATVLIYGLKGTI